MKILLINPVAMRKPDFPPLGLLSIGTVLKKKGYEVKVLDAAAQSLTNETIIKMAKNFKPDLCGITTYIVNENQCFQIARDFKKHLGCPVILGGPHASCFPRKIIAKEESVDGIVVMEGETTVLKLCCVLNQRSRWKEVHGMIFRDGDGKIIVNPPRDPISNLDDLPIPDRSLIDLSFYNPIPSMYRRLPATSVITAKGCPYSCTYCFEAGELAQKYRRKSPLKIIKEIEYLIENFGIREIALWDDEFVLNKKWVYSFCDLIQLRNIDITWSCFGRVGNVNPELLHKMAGSGCWSISYGIESGNQELLDFIKKGFTIKQAKDAIKWTHKAGIETRCSFMLALPGESPEMGQKTIDFAIDLDVDYAQFFATNPLPGTPLYENSQKLGTYIPDVNNYGFSRPSRAPFVPFAYKNEKQILDLLKKGHQKFYFRPAYILKALKRIKKPDDLYKCWNGIKMLLEV